MKYQVGQQIVFLHEAGGGIIKSILENGKIMVEDQDGFDRQFLFSELAPVYSQDYAISEEDIRGINEDETFSTAKHHVSRGELTGSRKAIDVWELDLHIEEITDSHSGWSNTDIVRKQLMELRTFVQKAKSKRIRKLIVIHGVGTGVLKEEVRSYFRKIPEVLEIYDASYSEYGKGATAVELSYS